MTLPTGEQGSALISRWWVVAGAILTLALLAYFYTLSQIGTDRELQAATAFSNFMIAAAAVLAVYVAVLQRAGETSSQGALLRFLQDRIPVGATVTRGPGLPASPQEAEAPRPPDTAPPPGSVAVDSDDPKDDSDSGPANGKHRRGRTPRHPA